MSSDEKDRPQNVVEHFARIAQIEAVKDEWKNDLSPEDRNFVERIEQIDKRVNERNNIDYSRFGKNKGR